MTKTSRATNKQNSILDFSKVDDHTRTVYCDGVFVGWIHESSDNSHLFFNSVKTHTDYGLSLFHNSKEDAEREILDILETL